MGAHSGQFFENMNGSTHTSTFGSTSPLNYITTHRQLIWCSLAAWR